MFKRFFNNTNSNIRPNEKKSKIDLSNSDDFKTVVLGNSRQSSQNNSAQNVMKVKKITPFTNTSEDPVDLDREESHEMISIVTHYSVDKANARNHVASLLENNSGQVSETQDNLDQICQGNISAIEKGQE
jgi:endonuclease III